jgi:hypothetical protein
MIYKGTMKEEGKLYGWKQIARFFEKDERTVLDWEKKYKLPIRRDGPGKRPRVYALIPELDKWRESLNIGELNTDIQRKPEALTPQNESRALKSAWAGLKKYFLIIFFSTLLIIVGLTLGSKLSTCSGKKLRQPTDFDIEGSQLIILDEHGQEIWRYDTGLPYLSPERNYRKRFQYKWHENPFSRPPLIIIQDLDGDGANDVLFATAPSINQHGGSLIFLNSKGGKEWSFYGGRRLKFGKRYSSGDTRIFGVQICNLDNKGAPEIALIGYLNPYFPCYLEILDIKGNILGEFWNSGHIRDILFIDCYGDKRKEIVVSGVNNEYKEAFMAVFDSRDVRGASPQQDEKYICRDFGPSSAKFYIRFPRTDVDLLKKHLEFCSELQRLENGHIQAKMKFSQLYYEFDSQFEVTYVGVGNNFLFLHRTAVSEGKITSTLNEEYLENLKNGVLYYNGKEWVSKPSMANPWTD